MRACGRATAHVLRGWPPPRRVKETPPVNAEKEFLQRGVVARAIILTILTLAVRPSCRCPLRLLVGLFPLVMEHGGMAGVGHGPGGPLSGSPLVVAPMGCRWCESFESRDAIRVCTAGRVGGW